jgi:hypothetical protein
MNNTTSTHLSSKALLDLRIALKSSYGDAFDIDLTDEQINRLGNLFLVILAESLILKSTQDIWKQI